MNLSYSLAYHPQSDGQAKVMNSYLEHFLRCFSSEKLRLWFEWLPLAEWWYNTAFHSSTRLTSYEVVYGVLPTRLQANILGLSPNQAFEELLKTQE